jgi:hypothetical protein
LSEPPAKRTETAFTGLRRSKKQPVERYYRTAGFCPNCGTPYRWRGGRHASLCRRPPAWLRHAKGPVPGGTWHEAVVNRPASILEKGARVRPRRAIEAFPGKEQSSRADDGGPAGPTSASNVRP